MLLVNLALAVMSYPNVQALSLNELEGLFATNPTKAESWLRQQFSKTDLSSGVAPLKQETTVLFVIDPGPGSHRCEVKGSNLELTSLKTIGGLMAAVVNLKVGQGTTVQYMVDGKPTTKSYNLEVYKNNPAVNPPPGGRKGELRAMGDWKSSIFPGTTRKWFVFLPPGYDASKEYPILIGTDAQWDREWQANALENCAREGLIPATVGVFIEPGQDRPGNYSFRSHEYDTLNGDYAKFLLSEILPEVEKIVKLSRDPSQRACVGVSSGGICGFTACWEHPEAFSTVISAVGSFDDIAHGSSLKEGGHNYPFMIRLTDKKPIRAFLQDGANDLDNQFGNWFLGNAQMAAALKFKGYDYQWHPGEGFHSSDHLRSIFDKALVWWNGTKKTP